MPEEFSFIKRIEERQAQLPDGVVGIGDDCCVWNSGPQTALSIDSIVEGRHFTVEDDPAAVGGKAALAALSDLAGMGARPVGAVVALHCPSSWDGDAIMRGLEQALLQYACPLLGGDTTAADQLVISVTVWGEPGDSGRLLYRHGAEAADLLVVTGALGGSLKSGRHLRPRPRLEAGQWLAGCGFAKAMMDISDGLAGDARRLSEASDCGAVLFPNRLPVHPDVDPRFAPEAAALEDGEDYELLIAVSAPQWPTLQIAWPFDDLPLSLVGILQDKPGQYVEDPNGRVVVSPFAGYQHDI